MTAAGRIFLVRHGEAAASWGEDPDPGLSPLGTQQAARAAQPLHAQLGSLSVTLKSSPLRRARETAEPLAELCGRAVTIDDRFREIPSPVPLKQRHDWLTRFMGQRWSEQEAGILAWRDAIMEGVNTLSANSVVFTHFLVINTIIGRLAGDDDTLVFWPANASVTVLERRSGDLSLVALGEEMRSRVN